MRVFLITIDYGGVLQSQMAGLSNDFLSGFMGGELFDIEAAAAIIDESFVIEQKVWIGEADEVPYRIELSMNGSLGEEFYAAMFGGLAEEGAGFDTSAFGQMEITMKTNATTIYSDFGVPFEVQAPEDAQPYSDLFGNFFGGF